VSRVHGFCVSCGMGWENLYEDEVPSLRAEHSRSCTVKGHPKCRSQDIKIRPAQPATLPPDKAAQWQRMTEEADAQEMYIAMLIERDQWRRTEDELMAKWPWLVRTILKIRNTLK
jgi:hypothetical protein